MGLSGIGVPLTLSRAEHEKIKKGVAIEVDLYPVLTLIVWTKTKSGV